MANQFRKANARQGGTRIIRHQRLFFLLFGACLLTVGGCASTSNGVATTAATPEDSATAPSELEPTVVAFRDYRDPLIRVNRWVFAFNDVSYRYVLIPAGNAYVDVVPEGARQCISNFFYNIKAPIYLLNNLLQLKPKAAGINLARFGINTTLGLFGLFDPARHWFDLEKAETSFADTLAHYRVGYGIYLVIPLLGPSDLRNGVAALTDGYLHPVRYLLDNPERTGVQGFDYFQEFAPQAEAYLTLVAESDDPYIFLRNRHLQSIQRDAAYGSRAGEDEPEPPAQ